MNYNLQSGLSWHEWISNPQNKALYEWNQSEAMKKYRRDEDEFIREIILQERIQKQLIEQQESVLSPGIGSYAGAAGGAAAGAGGWNFNTGIGNYSIGTYLNEDRQQISEAVDEGFDRFTIT